MNPLANGEPSIHGPSAADGNADRLLIYSPLTCTVRDVADADFLRVLPPLDNLREIDAGCSHMLFSPLQVAA